ncbi:MAG TPA: ABC transporter ATP-binding protein [Armatimonadota bacterium]|nr:ABC transporter ATP-binding protein [Armatimonadota bacterium]
MRHNGPPVLELDDVTKAFPRRGQAPFIAVTDLNATVPNIEEEGEFITLIGPSGCGKSTLLQLIAGFDTHVPPTGGEVRFLGEPVTGPSHERGMMFQDYGCYPHLTVVDNIAFGLKLHAKRLGLSKDDIADTANDLRARVRLAEGDARKYPHELSGGMRQRVALARSLALKPRCLLMDEPFSALDEPTRFEMQDLIVELWSEIDATIILISHSVAEALYLGDRLWMMSSNPGTIVAEYTHIPHPDPGVPAMVAQGEYSFNELVAEVSREFLRVLETPRDELAPVHADGNGTGLRL